MALYRKSLAVVNLALTPSLMNAPAPSQIEGAATCVASVIAFMLLPAYPHTTTWLSAEEKALASARLASEGIGSAGSTGHGDGHWASFKQAMGDWVSFSQVSKSAPPSCI